MYGSSWLLAFPQLWYARTEATHQQSGTYNDACYMTHLEYHFYAILYISCTCFLSREKVTPWARFDESTNVFAFWLHIYWVFKCNSSKGPSINLKSGSKVVAFVWFVKVHPSGYFCSVAPHILPLFTINATSKSFQLGVASRIHQTLRVSVPAPHPSIMDGMHGWNWDGNRQPFKTTSRG